MHPQPNILEAMLHCSYKAWLLSKQEISAQATSSRTGLNPITVLALQISQPINAIAQDPIVKVTKNHKQAIQLLADTESLLNKEAPPTFYKVPHCSACQFKNECHSKLKERDCIGLLPSMTTKTMLKYHNKGITTITQLSYLFKPRRRRAPNPQSSYLWELKALAIREQKTFVIQHWFNLLRF